MLHGIDTVLNSLKDSLLPNSKPKSYFSKSLLAQSERLTARKYCDSLTNKK
jgi:hypothetical protein